MGHFLICTIKYKSQSFIAYLRYLFLAHRKTIDFCLTTFYVFINLLCINLVKTEAIILKEHLNNRSVTIKSFLVVVTLSSYAIHHVGNSGHCFPSWFVGLMHGPLFLPNVQSSLSKQVSEILGQEPIQKTFSDFLKTCQRCTLSGNICHPSPIH